MRVGVPKEIKVLENRVGLTPASVRELVHHGHQALVEPNAGQGIGASDDDYVRAGAEIAREHVGRDDRQGQGAAGERARDA